MDGVYEERGRCRIIWREGRRRKSLTLQIPYSPTGVKRAWKIREQHIKAFRRGDKETSPVQTFGKLSQTRLDTAQISPETRRTQKSYLNKYWSPLFQVPVSEIEYGDLLDLFGNLDKSPKTLKHILSAGSQVFELAIKSHWRTDNPARLYAKEVKLVKRKVDPFTREERDMILDDLKNNQHLFYAIRFYSGLRPSEAIALRWSDYTGGVFSITKGRVRGNEGPTKTKVDRVVPVHPYVQKALKAMPRQIHDSHIVTNQYGKAYQSSTRLSDAFSRSMKRLNIRYRSPYNVRHTAASMMLESGMRPAYCAKVLGHSLEMFFNVYADFVDKDESEAQRKIWFEID